MLTSPRGARGAVLGFLPYNFSKSMKIFMGDSGSLFLRVRAGAGRHGTQYSKINPLWCLRPAFYTGSPHLRHFFVSIMRLRRGILRFGQQGPFRPAVEKLGFSRARIVFGAAIVTVALSVFAWLITSAV